MKKHKICKILLVILAIFLCVAFYELLGICVAYKKQPEVSNTTKKETKNGSWNECSENTERAVIIEKNPEALLQRVRLIKNAKKEIILSTFAPKPAVPLCVLVLLQNRDGLPDRPRHRLRDKAHGDA